MKNEEVFDLRMFMSKFCEKGDELTEQQLNVVSSWLETAKENVDSKLRQVMDKRIHNDEDIRQAAIDFLLTKGEGTVMEVYSMFNQENCKVIKITGVSLDPGKTLTLSGEYENPCQTESIGDYGSELSQDSTYRIKLAIALDDMTVYGKTLEPPFHIRVEGWHKEIDILGKKAE